MSQSLKDKARAARESWGDEPHTSAEAEALPQPVKAAPATLAEVLPEIEYTGTIVDADKVSVHVAWNRVMADVKSVGKDDRFEGGSAGRYNYRGIDRVLNAVGPALRRHGVAVIPVATRPEYRDVVTAKGSKMRECTVVVDYMIYGPGGDTMPACSAGEAVDTSDKGTTKACTVAYRNLLITALSIPLQDPKLDAEAQHLERGERPLPKAADYVDEICDPRTSAARLRQIFGEVGRHGLMDAKVTDETGEEVSLRNLIKRKGEERAAEAGDEA